MVRVASSSPIRPLQVPAKGTQPRPVQASLARPVAPQAQAQGRATPRFDSIEAYKAYVRGTEVIRLPELRRAVLAEQAKVEPLRAELKRLEGLYGLKAKQDALAAAEQALEGAKFPHRPEAEAKRNEAGRVASEIGQLAAEVARQQSIIAAAQNSSSRRDERVWGGIWDDKPYDGWDAAGDIIGGLSNSATVRHAQKQIASLTQRKAQLEAQMMGLQSEAAALQFLPGEAGPVAQAQGKRDEAKRQLEASETKLKNTREAMKAAEAGLRQAQGEMIRVDEIKAGLQDYSEHFSWFDRTKWSLNGSGWKKDLEKFWQAY